MSEEAVAGASAPQPAVSIVIAVYNSERTLPALLSACRTQDHPGPLEIVVADDGSPDDSRRIAQEAGVRVVSQENRGPAAARNLGWRAARAPVILFTDADCVPAPDWARRLTAALDDDHAVATGSYGIANPGSHLAELVHAEIRWRHSRFAREVEFAGSYNLAMKREALVAVAGFDESFPAPSAEDNDLSYRLHDAGFRIRFVPEAIVAHHHPSSLGRYLREQERHGYWRVVLYALHPRRVKGDQYAGWADLGAPPLAALAGIALVLGVFVRGALVAAAVCAAAVLVLHVFLAVRVALFARSPKFLSLAVIGTLRAFARAWGMCRGGIAILRRRGTGR